MDVALITGASSGIGHAITCELLNAGWRVYGVGRDFEKNPITHDAYHPLTCDLANPEELDALCRDVLKKELRLDLLVNNAGVGYFGPHETLAVTDITTMVNVNLLAPMILTRGMLRALRAGNGMVINIGSTAGLEAKRLGCAYSATKAGLKHFGDCLFTEVRKQGVRVATISPDMTRTAFHDSLDFGPGDSPEAAILPETIADAVLHLLNTPQGTVINDMVIRPQKVEIQQKTR